MTVEGADVFLHQAVIVFKVTKVTSPQIEFFYMFCDAVSYVKLFLGL